MNRLFVVEDNDDIRELVVYALTSAGFEARGFQDGAEMFAALGQDSPNLILLDIMLPGEDGLALLRRLRSGAKTGQIPVILLTAKVAEHDRVRGLDLGADDYIIKPFSVLEVISRVRAVLRRSSPRDAEADDVARVGAVTLDARTRTVLSYGREAVLSFKEFELLRYLMQNCGVVMTRQRILDRVWGYDFAGESRTVDMHIKFLRGKLGVGAEIIRTVRGVGYKAEA
jgi:two-component system alkaline phosphatase synthesis response regulator PhoP